MSIPDVCLGRDYPGAGGVAGGAGPNGPVSNLAGGSGASSGSGWPMIMAMTNMRKVYTIELRDSLCGGGPVDLTGVAQVKFIAKEWPTAPETYIDKAMSIDTPVTDGHVSMTLTPSNLQYAGIWPAAVVCLNASSEVTAEYKCYLYVQQSYTVAGQTAQTTQPLQLHDIRLAMRDTCPEFNTLLDDLEFSDVEIMYALVRPVEEWNETSPDLSESGYSYTQNTFPWREHWRRATIGYLLQAAAFRYARNNLSYSAANLTVADMDKARDYSALSDSMLKEWRTWMTLKKREINTTLCYGGIHSVAFGGRFYYE